MVIADFSPKRIQINKANLTIVVAVGVATFLIIFSLFAGKALLSQRAYQSRVIAQQSVANKTVQENLKARDLLVVRYKEFIEQPTNIIGGTITGTGDRDGDNAKIVLDALPSKYDFPALASSIEKLVKDNGTTITSIAGSDDELNQQSAATAAEKPVEIPFQLSVSGGFESIQNLISVFERSIRPIKINTMTLTGADARLILNVNAVTYYQPETGLRVTTKVVK